MLILGYKCATVRRARKGRGASDESMSDAIGGEVMSPFPQHVYKVMQRIAWEPAHAAGAYAGSADDRRDGFIHLSTASQLAGTLAKHFRGQRDLLLIEFETLQLGAALLWEPSRGGDLFPHLYAPLPTRHAMRVRALHLGADEIPQLPEDLTAC